MYTKSEYLDELKSIRNAYLDDHMAYHAVGNVSRRYAYSLHVYTPGKG